MKSETADVAGCWQTGAVDDLDPEDREWAEQFGARWGAEYPRPRDDQKVISRKFSDMMTELGNERTAQRLRRHLGINSEALLTDAQLRAGEPYLAAMAEVAIRELQWALWWRREHLREGGEDPGSEYMDRRSNPEFYALMKLHGPKNVNVNISIRQVDDDEGVPDSPPLRRNSVPSEDSVSVNAGISKEPAATSYFQRRRARKEQRETGRFAKELAEVRHRAAERERKQQVAAEALRAEQVRIAAEADRRVRIAAERERIRLEEEEIRRRRPPAPEAQPYGVNHQGAERFAADWMRHLGVHDAQVTQYSGDGGIDVTSRYVIAQVKNLHSSASVPIAQIRDLLGTATHQKKRAVLFTSGQVSQNGLTFAHETGIAIVRYEAERGTLTGLNLLGRLAIQHGFPATFNFDEF